MTVVVADSSPLNYFTLIGSVDVLPRLYGSVVVPVQVIEELVDPQRQSTSDGGHAIFLRARCY
jgi:predicted nucleic acid-binding protein